MPDVELEEDLLTSTSAEVSWATVNTATEYRITVKQGSNQVLALKVPTGLLSYSIQNLIAATTYTVTLKACTASGCSVESNPLSFTTYPAPPAIPSGLSGSAFSSDSLRLTWKSVVGAKKYEVRAIDEKLSFLDNEDDVRTMESTTNSIIFTGLVPDSQYRVEVASVGQSKSEYSSSILVATMAEAPDAALVEEIQANSAVATWEDDLNAQAYIVSIVDSNLKTISSKVTQGTSAGFIGLRPSTRYRIKLQYRTFTGRHSEPTFTAFTTKTLPPRPSMVKGIKIKRLSKKSFRVSWNKSRGATSYTIRVLVGNKNLVSKTFTKRRVHVKGIFVKKKITVIIIARGIGGESQTSIKTLRAK
ncbi:fibronectin type III domain-containing protein [Rarobacter faecitabidus]|nr:fibronectin type III domain-containing protein [Rarobacter faecitabidus]